MPNTRRESPVGAAKGGVEPGMPPASLASNFGALAVSHATGLIVPLLMVPYLARVLRPEGWAPVLIAQALASAGVLVLEYAFDLSATRAIAAARATGTDMTALVWHVQGAKLLLVPVAAALMLAGSLTIPALRGAVSLSMWAFVFVLARGLSPLWYFIGRERVRYAVAVDTAGRAAGALAALLFVHAPADGWRVLALQAVFAGISCLLLTVRLWREVPPLAFSFERSFETLRRAWTLFAFRASSVLYLQANVVLLGFFASPTAVAAYGGAEKLVRAALNLLDPVTKTLMPRIAFLRGHDPEEAARLIARALFVLGGLAGLGAAVLEFAAPLVVRLLLGPGYEEAIPVLRLLALLLPIIATATVFGAFWALPFARERALLAVTAAAGVVNVVLAALLVPQWGALGMASAVVLVESMVCGVMGALYVRWLRGAHVQREATA